MRKNITKVIGLLVAIAVLVSGIYGVFTIAQDPAVTEPKTASYYVQYGGKGDGLSAESPVATVDDAIKAANAAGLGAGDDIPKSFILYGRGFETKVCFSTLSAASLLGRLE